MKGVKTWAAGCLSIVLSIAGISRADGVVYHNGFENAGDETAFNGGTNITRVHGTLGFPASSGSYYAVLHNSPDGYSAGYGDSTFTYFGGTSYGGSGPFTETTDYYIDAQNWAAPTNPAVPAFWIDSSPAGTDHFSDYADEVNFQVSVPTAGTVDIAALGSNPVATITQSGWYTFSMSFDPGADGFVHNTLSVLDHGTVLGSYVYTSAMPNADLTGSRYGDWTTVWQNGFAGNELAIDNVDITAAPLPSAAWTGLALLGGLVAWIVVRRRGTAAAA